MHMYTLYAYIRVNISIHKFPVGHSGLGKDLSNRFVKLIDPFRHFQPFRRMPQSLRKPFVRESPSPNRLSLPFRMLLHRQTTQNRQRNLSRVSPKWSEISCHRSTPPRQASPSLRKLFFCQYPCPNRLSVPFRMLLYCRMAQKHRKTLS